MSEWVHEYLEVAFVLLFAIATINPALKRYVQEAKTSGSWRLWNEDARVRTTAVAGGMEARGGVRSSARLSNEAVRSTGSGSSGNGRAAEVSAAAAAAAAVRRARAAERAREVEDSPRVLREKCRRLARALRNAKHLVVSVRNITCNYSWGYSGLELGRAIDE